MPMEFHVSRAARERYRVDASLFSVTGNVLLPDFPATRRLAAAMNAARDPGAPPVQAGDLNAMGLVDEILHVVVCDVPRDARRRGDERRARRRARARRGAAGRRDASRLLRRVPGARRPSRRGGPGRLPRRDDRRDPEPRRRPRGDDAPAAREPQPRIRAVPRALRRPRPRRGDGVRARSSTPSPTTSAPSRPSGRTASRSSRCSAPRRSPRRTRSRASSGSSAIAGACCSAGTSTASW